MRARVSLAAVVLCACVTGVAYAGGPGGVYNDFAQDGKLSCNHSRGDLQAVLRSGVINQYGDPYTVARLKLAIRRRLAGGCPLHTSSSQISGRTRGEPATGSKTRGTGAGKNGRTSTVKRYRPGGSSHSTAAAVLSNTGNSGFVWEHVLVAALLVGGVAVGGWLTKRALAARN
jgi:hypothetical protein